MADDDWCNKCGACCRAAGALLPDLLPIALDGSCANLVNNECSIWETRPQFCRSDAMRPAGISKEDYIAQGKRGCEVLRECFPDPVARE